MNTNSRTSSVYDVQVVKLSDHRDHIAAVATELFNEWGVLYQNEGINTVDALIVELHKRCDKPNQLPVTLIALLNENDSTQFVGTISIDVDDLPKMNPYHSATPWLASVFVIASHRSKGIAGQLIKAAQIEASARGLRWLWLWTVRSVAMYERFGWNVIEQLPLMCDKESKQIVVMRKDLD